MPLSYLFLKNSMSKTKLNELKIVHKLWIFQYKFDNIVFILIDFQVFNDGIQLL